MRIASIDIGTNTTLLLIADVDLITGNLTPIHHEQRFPRIGKDVDEKKQIQLSAFERTRAILSDYQQIITQYSVEKIVASATSAVRDSENRQDFVTYLKNETGISVDIISGEEEAYLTYLGAVSGLSTDVIASPALGWTWQSPNTQEKSNNLIVIDIGGGSTEISYKDSSNNFNKTSLQVGSVRLTERYFKHNPPTKEEIEQASNFIITHLAGVILNEAKQMPTARREESSKSHGEEILLQLKRNQNDKNALFHLIGVAGTVTTLACLDQGLLDFEVTKVSGYSLSKDKVQFWFDKLSMLPTNEIQKLSNTTQGRADILTAGSLILLEFMKQFGFNEIIVSERGLRYGMALKYLREEM